MSGYTPGDLQGHWQFKIVKGNFKTREQIDAVVQEQAEWGWILVEVFDHSRIRFKRPPSEAAKDSYREGNPYATTSNSGFGCGSAAALLFMLIVAGAYWFI